jgi:hypothetical protein
MSVAFVKGHDNSFSLMLNNGLHTVHSTDPSFEQVKQGLKENKPESFFLRLLEKAKTVAKFTQGKVEVRHGEVLYNGEPVHGLVTQRILQYAAEGLPVEPLLRFLEKLMQNPSYNSRTELFDFLERLGLTICEDGDFYAFKVVRSDYKDKYSGRIDNSPGQLVKMERGKVDDNRDRHCSSGLHAGCMKYIHWYGNLAGGDKVVIVKINPANCVSVPTDHDFMKLRTSEYLVVADYAGDLTATLYDSNFKPVVGGNYDWDLDGDGLDDNYDDYDDYDDDDLDFFADDDDEDDDMDDNWGEDDEVTSVPAKPKRVQYGRFTS